jgi:FtsP/CotA-like multicopper oxidase with cupredoxin domain
VGAAYQNVTNQFRPYYSNPAPTPNKRIFLNNTAESWSGKERDVLNNLAFYPNPAQVPLLVGMYNGQVVVDQAAEARAAAQGNYFDSTTGAYLLEVGDVVEVILQNQVGLNNVVTHPFHMHGGDFWDMGGGDGEFSEEAYQELLATVDPVKRDTTLLSGLPASRGTTGNPQGFRVWRWEATAKGAWMLHWYIIPFVK